MVIFRNIDIDMGFLENIDIDKEIWKNIDIDIDMDILQNINIDEISYRLEYGISNRATQWRNDLGRTSYTSTSSNKGNCKKHISCFLRIVFCIL